MKQKEIIKALILISKLIWLYDDGYHNKEIQNLVKMSNDLYVKLPLKIREKFSIWLERKEKEISGE